MTDYRHGARCADVPDPEVFFPLDERTGSGPAKLVCAACPVRAACLDWALTAGVVGVWGGTTTEERRSLRLALRVLSTSTAAS